jgi:hypothetical protein
MPGGGVGIALRENALHRIRPEENRGHGPLPQEYRSRAWPAPTGIQIAGMARSHRNTDRGHGPLPQEYRSRAGPAPTGIQIAGRARSHRNTDRGHGPLPQEYRSRAWPAPTGIRIARKARSCRDGEGAARRERKPGSGLIFRHEKLDLTSIFRGSRTSAWILRGPRTSIRNDQPTPRVELQLLRQATMPSRVRRMGASMRGSGRRRCAWLVPMRS